MKQRFKKWLGSQSMFRKLFASFSAAVILLLFCVMLLLNSIISRNYREKLLYSANQSFEQARMFLQSYIDSLCYVSDLIYYSGDLQRVLSSKEFNGERDLAIQYREFLALDTVFTSAELIETVYQARIFIPEGISYANHKRHFCSEEELKARPDYEQLKAAVSRNKFYFSAPEQVTVSENGAQESILSLFRMIRSVNDIWTPIGVQQISLKTELIQSVIDKSNVTQKGIIYLVNDRGELISLSHGQHGRELFGELSSAGALPASSTGRDWSQETLLGKTYWVNLSRPEKTDWTLVALLPESEVVGQSGQISALILVFTIAAVVFIFLISFFVAKYYTRRLNVLKDRMKDVQSGTLDIPETDFGRDEIGTLFQSFHYMTGEVKRLLDEQYRSGKAIKAEQLNALRAQINPHFLYNILDMINWTALDNNTPRIAEMVQSLARFYRLSLNKGKQIVTIETELLHAAEYVKIENYHFDNTIRLVLDVPDEIRKLSCLSILLQPLVENSIMHGIDENGSKDGCTITVSARRADRDVILTVSDDGIGMTPEQVGQIFSGCSSSSAHGYGVRNIDERIKLLYGNFYGLSYTSTVGQGTSAEIRIPALEPEEAEKLN